MNFNKDFREALTRHTEAAVIVVAATQRRLDALKAKITPIDGFIWEGDERLNSKAHPYRQYALFLVADEESPEQFAGFMGPVISIFIGDSEVPWNITAILRGNMVGAVYASWTNLGLCKHWGSVE